MKPNRKIPKAKHMSDKSGIKGRPRVQLNVFRSRWSVLTSNPAGT